MTQDGEVVQVCIEDLIVRQSQEDAVLRYCSKLWRETGGERKRGERRKRGEGIWRGRKGKRVIEGESKIDTVHSALFICRTTIRHYVSTMEDREDKKDKRWEREGRRWRARGVKRSEKIK